MPRDAEHCNPTARLLVVVSLARECMSMEGMMDVGEYLWQLYRACEKRRYADSSGQYKFWTKYVNYAETMAVQAGATEEELELARKGDGFRLQARLEARR